jgi:hypothetical protein
MGVCPLRSAARVAKGELLAPTSAEATKSAKPQQDVENQTKQDELIENHKKQSSVGRLRRASVFVTAQALRRRDQFVVEAVWTRPKNFQAT